MSGSLSMSEQACYTLIAPRPDGSAVAGAAAAAGDAPTDAQIKNTLEKGDNKAKAETLKRLITTIVNGENVGRDMLMYVIRFCLPSQDHLIKKLLLIFWEVVPKTSSDGKLLQEMILVCDAYRKDLQHPNEFIRGSTLRFLCKLKEPELIEPLMPAIRACLEHRHSYVRRNAVMAVYTIYRNFEFLIPDAPELVYNFLEAEQDASCRRNAFMMLLHADQARALDYLQSCIDQVNQFGEILQLIIVELIYKVCHSNPSERARFIRCVYNLLQSSSAAVRYEAAGTLLTLSSAPTAVRAAAGAYVELVLRESDNNVKLIVLDRLAAVRQCNASGERVLHDMAMDVLRVLHAPDLEVRRKTLALALDLVTARNVDEVVMFLRKEITRASSASAGSDDTVGKYRQLLVKALHAVSAKFSDTAAGVVPALLECLSDASDQAAGDVLVFVRDACARLPQLRPVVLHNLAASFGSIRDVKIFRAALWILGEFCETDETIQAVMTLVRQSLGELPIVESETRAAADGEADAADPSRDTAMKAHIKPLVTADGTYKTESALSMQQSKEKRAASSSSERPALRKFLLHGDFFVASALASVLCKLAIRYQRLKADKPAAANAFTAESLYIMACLLHLGKSAVPHKHMTEDDLDRIATCFRVLAERCPSAEPIYAHRCRQSLELMLNAKKADSADEFKGVAGDAEQKKLATPVDQCIVYPQLASRVDTAEAGKENLFDLSLSQALGAVHSGKSAGAAGDFSSSKLGKVTQLSGMNDPVYAEAYINVNQYDIVLDVLLVNQTSQTLEGVTLELATLGDLRLVEKPTPITLAPHDFANIKANAKVASTENSVIFGTIVYDVRGSTSDRNAVYLADMHIDIMDYIVPAHCTDQQFRAMWAEFEWENKVAVNTSITDLRQFLEHLVSCTNMRCLTPAEALTGDCGLLAANLYAHSVFGEDALANLSIEKADAAEPTSPVVGHIRIRAKSQGMALSLGDKVNSAQKQSPQQTAQGKKQPKHDSADADGDTGDARS